MDVELNAYFIIYIFSIIGIIYAAICAYKVFDVEVKPIEAGHGKLELTETQVHHLKETASLIESGANTFLFREYLYMIVFIIVFTIAIVFLAEKQLGFFYTSVAFIIGAFTSLGAGFIGMKIATKTNIRTAYKACYSMGDAFNVAYLGGCVMGFFLVSISIIVLCTLILIYKAIHFGDHVTIEDWSIIFEGIAGYGLGGSSVALFCRVGGGIYTKAADVGADLVAKLELGLEEDDRSNPATIADNVGDNVGDIAGMGSDLFGSMAESLCAALLVAATSPELTSTGCYLYPILISATGIVVCVITTYVGLTASEEIRQYSELEDTILFQLLISTVMLIPSLMLVSNYYLPPTFDLGTEGTISFKEGISKDLTVICPLIGLISGLLIGLSTYYYTSPNSAPVLSLVEGCKQGPAINVILGIALGFMSNFLPTILIGLTLYFSFSIAGMFGIALAAIGMLSNLPVCLAIDGYGPISDNAGGLAEMCELNAGVRKITDELDAAGNTTAAIGKGFAIGSACLCAFALFGAFVTKTELKNINLMSPLIMSGLLLGSMLPFLFSALTMKAVGSTAQEMIHAIREIVSKKPKGEKVSATAEETNSCIKISTDSSLKYMILPGLIVIFSPLLIGLLFGATCVAGVLIGIIISGIQMAISASNTGGAWDNCKKIIKKLGIKYSRLEAMYNDKNALSRKIYKMKKEGTFSQEQIQPFIDELAELQVVIDKMEEIIKNNDGKIPEERLINAPRNKNLQGEELEKEEERRRLIKDLNTPVIITSKKHTTYFKQAEKASIIGDTVGDPLKDTSGPSLNILIKLSSIISVVFGGFYLNTGYLEQYFFI